VTKRSRSQARPSRAQRSATTSPEPASRPRAGGFAGRVRTAVKRPLRRSRSRQPPAGQAAEYAVGPPPRRLQRRLVGWIALAASSGWDAALAGAVGWGIYEQHQANATQARNQRFVDTATQVWSICSATTGHIDQSVARFVEGTAGRCTACSSPTTTSRTSSSVPPY